MDTHIGVSRYPRNAQHITNVDSATATAMHGPTSISFLKDAELTEYDLLNRVVACITNALQILYQAAVNDGIPMIKICVEPGAKYGTVVPLKTTSDPIANKQNKFVGSSVIASSKPVPDSQEFTNMPTHTTRVERKPHEQWGLSFRLVPKFGMVVQEIQRGSAASHYTELQPGVCIVSVNGKSLLDSLSDTEWITNLLAKSTALSLELISAPVSQYGGVLTFSRSTMNEDWELSIDRYPNGRGVMFHAVSGSACNVLVRYPRLKNAEVLEINGLSTISNEISKIEQMILKSKILTCVLAPHQSPQREIVILTRSGMKERWCIHIAQSEDGKIAVLRTFGQIKIDYPHLAPGTPILEVNGSSTRFMNLASVQKLFKDENKIALTVDSHVHGRVDLLKLQSNGDDGSESDETSSESGDDVNLYKEDSDSDETDAFYHLQPIRADISYLVQHIQMHREYYTSAFNMQPSIIDTKIAWLQSVRTDLAQADPKQIHSDRIIEAFNFATILARATNDASTYDVLTNLQEKFHAMRSSDGDTDSSNSTPITSMNTQQIPQVELLTNQVKFRAPELKPKAASTAKVGAVKGRATMDEGKADQIAAALSSARARLHNATLRTLQTKVDMLQSKLENVSTFKQEVNEVKIKMEEEIETLRLENEQHLHQLRDQLESMRAESVLSIDDESEGGVDVAVQASFRDTSTYDSDILNQRQSYELHDLAGGPTQMDHELLDQDTTRYLIEDALNNRCESKQSTEAIVQSMIPADSSLPPVIEAQSTAPVTAIEKLHDTEFLLSSLDTAFEISGAGLYSVNGIYIRSHDFKDRPRYTKLGEGLPKRATWTRDIDESWGFTLVTTSSRRAPLIVESITPGSAGLSCLHDLSPPFVLLEVNRIPASSDSSNTILEMIEQETTLHVVFATYGLWADKSGRLMEIKWDWDFHTATNADDWPNHCDYLGYWIGLKAQFEGKDENYYYNPANLKELPTTGWETTPIGTDPTPLLSKVREVKSVKAID